MNVCYFLLIQDNRCGRTGCPLSYSLLRQWQQFLLGTRSLSKTTFPGSLESQLNHVTGVWPTRHEQNVNFWILCGALNRKGRYPPFSPFLSSEDSMVMRMRFVLCGHGLLPRCDERVCVCVCVCVCAQSCPIVWDPVDCSSQAPLSMEFSRQ